MTAALTIDGVELGEVPIDLLSERLAGLQALERCELWLTTSSGPALCMLKSGARVLLMYLRFAEDVGLTSRAVGLGGPGELEFTLSNGQVDHYPAEWTVTFEEAARAAEYFWFKGERAPFVSWHDDAD